VIGCLIFLTCLTTETLAQPLLLGRKMEHKACVVEMKLDTAFASRLMSSSSMDRRRDLLMVIQIYDPCCRLAHDLLWSADSPWNRNRASRSRPRIQDFAWASFSTGFCGRDAKFFLLFRLRFRIARDVLPLMRLLGVKVCAQMVPPALV